MMMTFILVIALTCSVDVRWKTQMSAVFKQQQYE